MNQTEHGFVPRVRGMARWRPPSATGAVRLFSATEAGGGRFSSNGRCRRPGARRAKRKEEYATPVEHGSCRQDEGVADLHP